VRAAAFRRGTGHPLHHAQPVYGDSRGLAEFAHGSAHLSNVALLTWDQYAVRWAGLHGGVDPRSGVFTERWLRLSYRTGRLLARLRVKPSLITTIGMLASLAVPVLVVRHGYWPLAGAGLVLLSGFADSVDGAIAVVTNRVTRLGYVYDSVADRISEAAWMVALWLAGAPGWLAVLVGGLAWLHEYIRARATAAGMSEIGAVTLGERPVRLVLIALGLVVAGVAGLLAPDLPSGVVTIAAAIAALLGVIGLVQLVNAVQIELTKPQKPRR
jgi:CDP-diacylglycerol--glycerol-3-phosphate 3-phosphatidyltransferase